VLWVIDKILWVREPECTFGNKCKILYKSLNLNIFIVSSNVFRIIIFNISHKLFMKSLVETSLLLNLFPFFCKGIYK